MKNLKSIIIKYVLIFAIATITLAVTDVALWLWTTHVSPINEHFKGFIKGVILGTVLASKN